ncbi:MAG: hypothetical protein J6J17_05320 [Bacilli bacterium]|nr:hypothetical protein [Bacilli bacterium]
MDINQIVSNLEFYKNDYPNQKKYIDKLIELIYKCENSKDKNSMYQDNFKVNSYDELNNLLQKVIIKKESEEKIIREQINFYKGEGFNFEYALYIPKNISSNSRLIVSTVNSGKSSNDFESGVFSLKSEYIFDNNVKEIFKISEELGCPVMIPMIPRFRGYDTHILSYDVRNNNFDKAYDLSDDAKNISMNDMEKFRNLVEQEICMINDCINRLQLPNQKAFITGFSAGSKAALKLANSNPELFEAIAVGGTTGIEDVENLDMPILIQNGLKDRNNPVAYLTCFSEEEKNTLSTRYNFDFSLKNTELKEIFEKRARDNTKENVRYINYENFGHDVGETKEYYDEIKKYFNLIMNYNLDEKDSKKI